MGFAYNTSADPSYNVRLVYSDFQRFILHSFRRLERMSGSLTMGKCTICAKLISLQIFCHMYIDSLNCFQEM